MASSWLRRPKGRRRHTVRLAFKCAPPNVRLAEAGAASASSAESGGRSADVSRAYDERPSRFIRARHGDVHRARQIADGAADVAEVGGEDELDFVLARRQW